MICKDKNKLLIVLNPVAGKGRGRDCLFNAVDTFTKHGYRVTVLPTSAERSTTETVSAEAGSYDTIVAVGGDGTLNEVASGIVASGADTAMGYIPLGSTNDFGTSLGLPKDIKTACDFIAKTEPKRIDIGRFGDRYFVYVACAGLLTSTSYSTPQQLKNALGHSAYVIKGVSELAAPKKIKCSVELENETIDGEFIYVGVSNTLRLGGIFSMPQSEVKFDDGCFELGMIKAPKNLIDGTNLFNNIINSNTASDSFLIRKVKKAVIRFDSPKGWSLDGENGGEASEAVIEIKEKALRFIY